MPTKTIILSTANKDYRELAQDIDFVCEVYETWGLTLVSTATMTNPKFGTATLFYLTFTCSESIPHDLPIPGMPTNRFTYAQTQATASRAASQQGGPSRGGRTRKLSRK
uniref:Uncharacterized protein n=1 Tax=viral metagenome TaxID=1070528 RepID=A0A6C0D376_9ZZZZ